MASDSVVTVRDRQDLSACTLSHRLFSLDTGTETNVIYGQVFLLFSVCSRNCSRKIVRDSDTTGRLYLTLGTYINFYKINGVKFFTPLTTLLKIVT